MRPALLPLLLLALPAGVPSGAQELASATVPKVVIPTTGSIVPSGRVLPAPAPLLRPASQPGLRSLYPWRLAITATVFWVGEQPGPNNPTPNTASSWDGAWKTSFGGYDDPDPANRIADFATGDFRPRAFVPKLNPFYIALPYNDKLGSGYKPEAARVVPWFTRCRPADGGSVLHGRWVQIHRNGRDCYAQWEDCGPWVTDDWRYVFGNAKPKNRSNGGAGVDISPAVRDYMRLRSGQQVHWRFVEDAQVPYGPWKRYGRQAGVNQGGPDVEAQRRYLDYLRQLRDQQYRSKSARELQY